MPRPTSRSDKHPPPMSKAGIERAVQAIADALTAQYAGIEAIPYDGRPLPPGARLLPAAAPLDDAEALDGVPPPVRPKRS